MVMCSSGVACSFHSFQALSNPVDSGLLAQALTSSRCLKVCIGNQSTRTISRNALALDGISKVGIVVVWPSLVSEDIVLNPGLEQHGYLLRKEVGYPEPSGRAVWECYR